MAKASEGYISKLKQKAAGIMPPEINSVEAQRNILYMVEAAVPMVSVCRKNAEEELWPKVKAEEITVQDARKKCAEYLNRLAGITIVENLKLESRKSEVLVKAWAAMDSYAQVLKPEESAKLRKLMDDVAAVLEMKETGMRSKQVEQMDMSTVPIDPSKVNIQIMTGPTQKVERKSDEKSEHSDFSEYTGATGKKRKVNPVAVIIALVLVVAIAVVCIGVAWDKDRVNKAEEAIDQIGTVTMESSGAIKNAETLYAELKEDQQAEVSNYDVLVAAREEYDRLSGLIDDAVNAIDNIGTVTLNSKSKIDRARKAYDALEPDQLTGYVEEEYKVLVQAEKDYAELYAAKLHDDGLALYQEKKYDEALAKFAEVVEDYPNHTDAASSKVYASKCMVVKAQEKFDNGEYEATMNLLDESRAKYGDSADNKELTDKLIKKLESLRPKQNGKKFKEGIAWGYGKLNVIAGDQDVVVKIVSLTNPEEYMTFYVYANSSYEVSLKNGDYKVMYGTGKYWFGDKAAFGESGEYKEVNKTFSYTSSREGSYIYYNARKLDLTAKVSATEIAYDKFWN